MARGLRSGLIGESMVMGASGSAVRPRTQVRAGYYWKPQGAEEYPAQSAERTRGRRNDGTGSGAPRSYEELIRDYHGVVLGIAAKAGLSGEDAEDAAQTIEIRFWQRHGLEDYDPERLFEPPEGGWDDGREAVPRTARFATMFKTFVLLSMRGERDRAGRWYARHCPEEELVETVGGDPCESVCEVDSARQWLERAVDALTEAGLGDWAKALVACGEGRLDKREDWALVLGCKVRSCKWAQEELRRHLLGVGMGPETLRNSA